MYTLGFRFKPYTNEQAIAEGPSILNYLKEAASENGIDKHMRFAQTVVAADWSDADNRWTLQIESDGQRREISCSFLFGCTGYYNYDEGYSPEFPGAEDFEGTIVHPQHWPEGPRLPGQEDRRHRQRRHRRDADPRADRLGIRSRDDAAAHAHLYRRDA
jgi:monooxygenase